MIDGGTKRLYARDPSKFRDALIVDVDGHPRRFGDVMDPWQREDFARLDPALLRCLGRSDAPAKMRAFFERARGHSKTTDIAVVVVYLLCFAPRPLRLYSYAADRDQAGLLRDACQAIVRMNPWIGELLTVEKDAIRNRRTDHPGYDSSLRIETSDVGSSYGILPDAIVFDELCHWPDNAEGLWSSLMSSAAKRSNCLMFGITNSGFVDTWQWGVRESIRRDDGWVFSRQEGVTASWMTPERLEEQRRLLPPVAFSRLWENRWSSGGGDALRQEDIEAAFVPGTLPMNGNESEFDFVGGLDLGLTRDASALCILGVGRSNTPQSGRIRLAHTRLWRPKYGSRVSLVEVEEEIRRVAKRYDLRETSYDPWQAQLAADRLSLTNITMREVTPTGKNLQDIAARLLEAFTDRRLTLYEEPNLKRDLLKLRVEERNYGYRLVSPRDEHGHGDMASAFGLALLSAAELAAEPFVILGPLF